MLIIKAKGMSCCMVVELTTESEEVNVIVLFSWAQEQMFSWAHDWQCAEEIERVLILGKR